MRTFKVSGKKSRQTAVQAKRTFDSTKKALSIKTEGHSPPNGYD
jgi:hypothetical protein